MPDGNGAGIRAEGAGLSVRQCVFADNENGILCGAHPASDILIEGCVFALNGAGDGYTHNLYIGAVRQLTVRHSYLRGARGGHSIKSRAALSAILCNRISDEADGETGYELEFPSGGVAVVVGNIVQQGPRTTNNALVSIGAEGLQHPRNELHATHNTLVSDRTGGARFVVVRPGLGLARLENNVYSGVGTLLVGDARLAGNVALRPADFADAAGRDYRPLPGAPVAVPPVSAEEVAGWSLRPGQEYVHTALWRARPDARAPVAGALAIAPAIPR